MRKCLKRLTLFMVLVIVLSFSIAALASTPIVGLYTEGTFYDDGSWSFNPIILSVPRVFVSSAIRHPDEINIWVDRETYLSWMVEETFLISGQNIPFASPFYNIHLLADAGSELTISIREYALDIVSHEDFRFGGVRVQRISSLRGYTELSPGNFILRNATSSVLLEVEEVTEPISLTLSNNALYLVEIWQGEDHGRGWGSVRTIPIATGSGPFASDSRWVAFCLIIALASVITIVAIIRIRRKKV